ncbi:MULTISPECIES: peptide-binding protein [Bacillus]|nr:peptide-binding protein [Bacillus amyloliquefaciens]AIW33104.1 peptide-binding protein [Bacillus subtilis]AEB24548.1 oligopeptide ABC transporter oligopeptide-binding protein AppA [Bacillus amyloliquefaciens TA208]AEB62759.1 oligopeptide ABC transporter (oligopeptide-binding lipoprotein); C-terminal part of AppA [Bacillus amyloliquefaciens LL3]AEK89563.1 oligopeptide-binding protein AppA precursor [Bacillus amyloliquefaciens XH7]AZV88665.1 peptide-binding protein [Bacillus amyloliquefaciens
MKLRKTALMMLSVFMTLAIFLSACSGSKSTSTESKPAGKPQKGGDLVVGSTGEPTLFNPLYSTDVASSDIEGMIYSTLLETDEKLNVKPSLAEKVTEADGGLTYNVKLKKGVKFHDGKELTADDVVFTYSIPLNKDYNGERGSGFESLKSVTKKGKYEIQFKMKKKDAYFYNVVLDSYGILPKHILGKVPVADLGENEFNRKNPIGSGPFKFAEWKKGEYVKLKANDDYFGGRPYLDTVTVKTIPDSNAAVAQLKAGDIDFFVVPGTDFDSVKTFGNVKVKSDLGLNYSYIGWNEKKELFKDKKVRQALTYALDRQAMVDQVLNGDGKVANVPESPLSWNYPKSKVPTFDYNPKKAKQLLKEAGWEDHDGDGYLDKDGKKFSFEIKTNQGNKIREDLAVVVQQQLKEVGIEAKPRIVEFSALIEQTSAPNWDYDALLLGWSLATFPDQFSIFHSSQSKNGLNNIWYKNPKVDKLLEEAKSITDRKEYQKKYEEIYKLIAEDQPYSFLFYYNYHRAMPNNLQGYVFHPKNDLYNIEKWWLDQK